MDPLEPVRFVKHGCVCFESDDTVVYVDPYKVPDDAHDADLIVITHSHGDHYSPEDIERVRKEDTCFATTAEVARLLEEGLQKIGNGPAEAAFYGGSFTATPVSLQEELLSAVRPYLRDGRISSIRVSTRPDAVDVETLG